VEDISHGRIHDVSVHASLVNSIAKHTYIYGQSFYHGYHGIKTDEDVAGLISAVGWCCGWKTPLAIMEAVEEN
jgi:hypothetical protein